MLPLSDKIMLAMRPSPTAAGTAAEDVAMLEVMFKLLLKAKGPYT
jgi:hypothetical protein